MNYRKATLADVPKIIELLKLGNLPPDDCKDHLEHFLVVEENEKVIGAGGLEICGSEGLVRSMVVAPEHRGRGIAQNLYRLIEGKAHESGIKTLYLLTESAAGYFKNLGFNVQERSEVPVSIMETRQFRELCPASATVMFRTISEQI